MKSVLSKILATLLAFVVFFSTTSFTVDLHYCCNQLVDSSFIHQAKDCESSLNDMNKQSCSLDDESCCFDKIISKVGQHDLKKNEKDENSFKITKAIVNNTEDCQFKWESKNTYPFKNYTPPKIIRNIHLLQAVFLI